MEWNIGGSDILFGFLTLIFLEIVLGIDNLVFISILADKLPEKQKKKARLVGLSCALIMRLLLLTLIGSLSRLTAPWFTLFEHSFSGRDVTLILGGLFLLAKGTMELHERLEGHANEEKSGKNKAYFWQVIAQIIILDSIFSLDSIITAVGMMQHLPIMILAVVIAMGVMMIASNFLMKFINRHPTVTILCLGFLMMIGLSLVTDGFGLYLPKKYLYAAIGFSVLIEAFNQIGRRNREKYIKTKDMRSRTADAVFRLLGGGKGETNLGETVDVIAEQAAIFDVFKPTEKEMIKEVLGLINRPVRSIMTPRNEVEWLDLKKTQGSLQESLKTMKHSRIILANEKIDEFIGVSLTKDILFSLLEHKIFNWQKVIKQPLVLHENTNVLHVLEKLRHFPVQIAIIVDEHGSFEGIVTPTDILEAIAGDFADEEDNPIMLDKQEDGSFLVDGSIDIRKLSHMLNIDLIDENNRYTTLGGYMLWHFGHLPLSGENFQEKNFIFEVQSVKLRNIGQVKIIPLSQDNEESVE